MPRSWSEAVKTCRQHPQKVNGRWCSCRVGWRYRLALPDPVTGQRGKPQWSETFPTKDAADRDQRDVRKAIDEGTFTHDRGMTLDTYLREWLAGRERAGLKKSTLAGYRDAIELYLIPSLGKHRVGALRPTHVQGMVDRLAESSWRRKGAEGRKVSPGTLVKVRAVLRAALSDAEKRRMVAQNVATLVTLPAVKAPRPVALEGDQLARFMSHIPAEHRLACALLLDALYGMRRGELLGLGWGDVDEARKRVHIRATLLEVEGVHPCPRCGDEHNRVLFDTPKSAAGERVYPLVPAIVRALELQRQRQDEDRATYGDDYADHGLVFARPDGNPWRPSWVSREFKRLLEESGAAAGLERVPSLKVLRSSMVTALHEQGAALEVISKVTGHADSGVTREHYLAVTAERTRREFEAISGLLTRSDRLTDHSAENSADAEEKGVAS